MLLICIIQKCQYLQTKNRYFKKEIQGCALRNITRSPKAPNYMYEVQGAQHKAYVKQLSLSGRPEAKVSRLRHPGTLRAQP